MNILFIAFALIFSLLTAMTPMAATQVGVGATFGEEGLQSFYFSVGEYFRVPEREVIVVRERHIPDEEIPVVFFLADRAHVAPAAIIDLRLRKRSWADIVVHYGLSPEIFYVPVKVEVKGTPYGRAYGYYRNKPKREWKKIVLKDDDVVNLVNLKFVSEHHKYSPDEVIRIRSKGKNFVVIHDDIRRGKKEKGEKEERGERGEKEGKHEDRGKGKGKGK